MTTVHRYLDGKMAITVESTQYGSSNPFFGNDEIIIEFGTKYKFKFNESNTGFIRRYYIPTIVAFMETYSKPAYQNDTLDLFIEMTRQLHKWHVENTDEKWYILARGIIIPLYDMVRDIFKKSPYSYIKEQFLFFVEMDMRRRIKDTALFTYGISNKHVYIVSDYSRTLNLITIIGKEFTRLCIGQNQALVNAIPAIDTALGYSDFPYKSVEDLSSFLMRFSMALQQNPTCSKDTFASKEDKEACSIIQAQMYNLR